MIKNARQFSITRTWLERFRTSAQTLAEQERPATENECMLLDIQRAAAEGQAKDLQAELDEYLFWTSPQGRATAQQVQQQVRTCIVGLPDMLVRLRLAAGLSHKQLADRLDMHEQQVQRYEAEDYGRASLTVLRTVAEALITALNENQMDEGKSA